MRNRENIEIIKRAPISRGVKNDMDKFFRDSYMQLLLDPEIPSNILECLIDMMKFDGDRNTLNRIKRINTLKSLKSLKSRSEPFFNSDNLENFDVTFNLVCNYP